MSNETKPLKRYDPIHYSDMGGWSWDMSAIKECEDGDYVLFDDVQAERTKLMAVLQVFADTIVRLPGHNEADATAKRNAISQLKQLGIEPLCPNEPTY